MDKPHYQVMGNSGDTFRYMAYPFQRQQLQLLYPGRQMEQWYHYSGDNIPNSNPMGLRVTKEIENTLEDVSRMENEALARRYGGLYNIVNYPAVEPEALLEDPNLNSLNIKDTIGLSPNTEYVYSPYDNLSGTYETGQSIVDYVRSKEEGRDQRNRFVDNKLPRYNWKKIPEEEYPPPFYNSTKKKTLNKEFKNQNYNKPYSRNARESYARGATTRNTSLKKRPPVKRTRRTSNSQSISERKVLNCQIDPNGNKICTKLTCGGDDGCTTQICDEYGEQCGPVDYCNLNQCTSDYAFKWSVKTPLDGGGYSRTVCNPISKTCNYTVCYDNNCINDPSQNECKYENACTNGNSNMKTRIDCSTTGCTVYNCGDDTCLKQGGCNSVEQNNFGGLYYAQDCSTDISSCGDKRICNKNLDPGQDEEAEIDCSKGQCTELKCDNTTKTCKTRECPNGLLNCNDVSFTNCNYDDMCDNNNDEKLPLHKRIPLWGWVLIGIGILLFFILLIWLIYYIMHSGKESEVQDYPPVPRRSNTPKPLQDAPLVHSRHNHPRIKVNLPDDQIYVLPTHSSFIPGLPLIGNPLDPENPNHEYYDYLGDKNLIEEEMMNYYSPPQPPQPPQPIYIPPPPTLDNLSITLKELKESLKSVVFR